jgi:hypothetical protein
VARARDRPHIDDTLDAVRTKDVHELLERMRGVTDGEQKCRRAPAARTGSLDL